MFSLLFFTNFIAIWQNSFSTKILFYEFLFYFLTSLCCRREILGIVCQTCFSSKIFISRIQTFYHAKGAFYKEDGNPTEWKQWKWPLGSEYSSHNKITTCENTWQQLNECLNLIWSCFSYGWRTPPAGPSTRTRCRSRWSRLTWSRGSLSNTQLTSSLSPRLQVSQSSLLIVHYTLPCLGLVEAHKGGKIASVITVESGHSIGTSLAVLRMYYRSLSSLSSCHYHCHSRLGARSLTLTHNCNNPWADSSLVDKEGNNPVHNGLTSFGKVSVRNVRSRFEEKINWFYLMTSGPRIKCSKLIFQK